MLPPPTTTAAPRPSPDRIETHVTISAEAWPTLGELVAVLASIAARVGVDEELRWRIAALHRAIAGRDPSPLPLALGDTGREPPPAVIAWSQELADGACASATASSAMCSPSSGPRKLSPGS